VVTTIVLVRHGETDWNRERRFQGRSDTPLNDAGRKQVRELGRMLADERFAGVYTSPLARARESAEILAEAIGVARDVEAHDSLMEIDVGSWSGLTVTEVEARFPEAYVRWRASGRGWEDGETHEELGRRVVAGLLSIADRHHGDTVLAVTHGGPIRSALAAARGLPFESGHSEIGFVENCGVARLAVRGSVLAPID
jgi:broad specificity phosphatase PhoE